MQRLEAVDLTSDTKLFGLLLGGEKELSGFAGPGPLNTDDRPIVAFEAPRAAYVAGDSPGERLLSLINIMHPAPQAILAPGSDAEQRRLADYWRARDRYLALGIRTVVFDPSTLTCVACVPVISHMLPSAATRALSDVTTFTGRVTSSTTTFAVPALLLTTVKPLDPTPNSGSGSNNDATGWAVPSCNLAVEIERTEP